MAGVAANRDLADLLRGLRPTLLAGEFVFVSTSGPVDALPAAAMVREAEGVSYVVMRTDADARGLAYDFVGAWITLDVDSALDAVGLTAAVSTALADAGISANVIAGARHDHVVVPFDRAADALAVLHRLSGA